MHPRNFLRYMENCLEGLRDNICIPYLDDITVFSKSFNEHEEKIRTVLQRLCAHGIILKAKKCKLFKRKVNYLEELSLLLDIVWIHRTLRLCYYLKPPNQEPWVMSGNLLAC